MEPRRRALHDRHDETDEDDADLADSVKVKLGVAFGCIGLTGEYIAMLVKGSIL